MDQNEMYRRTNEYLNFDVNSYVRNGGSKLFSVCKLSSLISLEWI